MKILLICFLVTTPIFARKGFGPGEQEWGNVTVRPQAHMFWWLYYTSADVKNYTERPLIIWLSGGPGGSSTGLGNFYQIGTLDSDLNPRNLTWVKNANVLYVDNPVGVGWSHVDNQSALTTTNKQIADDFLVLLQGFYKSQPEFKNVPMYIMSESYGGKMAVDIALVLDKAIKEGKIVANFVGIGLGSAGISPMDCNKYLPSFLLYVGAVDQKGFKKIRTSAKKSEALFTTGKFSEAFDEYMRTRKIAQTESHGIVLANVLYKTKTQPNKTVTDIEILGEKFTKLMNLKVKEALGLNGTWAPFKDDVMETLKPDLLKPVTHSVETLLNKTNIKIAVYSGQLDAMVTTISTTFWVDNLRWSKSQQWPATPREVLSANNINEGYVKTLGNLALYWINRAGHGIPSDNPQAMDAVLRQLTDNYSGNVSRSL